VSALLITVNAQVVAIVTHAITWISMMMMMIIMIVVIKTNKSKICQQVQLIDLKKKKISKLPNSSLTVFNIYIYIYIYN
jgi:hypothetical protein